MGKDIGIAFIVIAFICLVACAIQFADDMTNRPHKTVPVTVEFADKTQMPVDDQRQIREDLKKFEDEIRELRRQIERLTEKLKPD